MDRNPYITAVAALSGVLTILLGLVAGVSDTLRSDMLRVEVEYASEYVDYVLVKRLEKNGATTDSLVFAKEELVLKKKKQQLEKQQIALGNIDRASVALSVALLLAQILIMFLALLNFQSVRTFATFFWAGVTACIVIASMSAFFLWRPGLS
jgi:hypothetical protein